MSTNAKSQIQRLGWRIKYVPHDVIDGNNATYNVEYEGKNVVTVAAKELGIPLNEVWISELWKPYEKYLFHHEVREIQHRAVGLSQEEAHEMEKVNSSVNPCILSHLRPFLNPQSFGRLAHRC